jgi:signal transduction histidine kinase/predicted RNA-binding protein with RPS1 domain
MENNYTIGQVVSAKIFRILPYSGVLVRLEDGTRGFIRRRELSWDEKEPDPRKYARPGQQIEAVVLSRDKERGTLSLSLRLRERDPWKDIEKRYPLNSEVEGFVTGILPDRGVFVQMEPGVDGFIPITHIHPEKKIQIVEEVLWMEDRVRAIVVALDVKLRHIQLSIKGYFDKKRREKLVVDRQESHEVPMEEILDPGIRETLYRSLEEEEHFEEFRLKPVKVRKILVIDDNPDFRNALIDWLKQKGYEPDFTKNGREGLEKFQSNTYDLIVLDSHLPDIRGVDIAEKVLEENPEIPILFVTGYEYDRDMERAEELKLSVWPKPLTEEDLFEIFLYLEKDGKLPVHPPILQAENSEVLQPKSGSLDLHKPLDKTFKTILYHLSREIKTDFLALFRANLPRHEVYLEKGIGVRALTDEQTYNLLYSPIRDIIETNKPVFEKTISRNRFKYLLKWIPFESCIGVPVPNHLQEDFYVLFAFHKSPGFFDDVHLLRIQAAAALIGAALMLNQTNEKLRQAQQWILKGQLGAGILHEVHNRLGGALLTSKTIQNSLYRASDKQQPDSDALKEQIEKLAENLDNTSESVKLFRRLSQEETLDEIDVNYSLKKISELFEPIANKNKVEIKQDFDKQIPRTKTISVRLDQIFCNIVLNGIEWMRQKPDACLTIRSRYDARDKKRPVKIFFQDRGPGIHKALFERVFEMGYTTKEGGTGLGLFIAKGLAASINSKISIEQSTMLIGSTFLVELPITP